MPRAPQDIYARLLSSPRGYPLWNPEPSNELLMERRDGLRIGDVGIVLDDGGFNILFNICLPAEHPFHRRYGVPRGFTCIDPSQLDIGTTPNAERPGRIISTSSVTRVETAEVSTRSDSSVPPYRFSLSSSEGALLILPKGAERYDLLNENLFLEQASLHGVEWYDYALNRRHRIISPDSLYLLTGIYKTRSWSVAAFENVTGNDHHTAHFKQIEGDPGTAPTYSWETTCALDWRVGPHIDYGIPNQAVFIRGFKIAIRSGFLGTRWISVEADVPSTRLNPVKSTSIVPGSFPVLSTLAGLVGRAGNSAFQSTQRSERTIEERPQSSNVPNHGPGGYEGVHIEIQRIPDAPPVFHPLDAINRYLLQKDPSANIAITHDSHWISLLEDDTLSPQELAQESWLETVLSRDYRVVSRQGVVYLERKPTDTRPPPASDPSTTTLILPDLSESLPHHSADNEAPPQERDSKTPLVRIQDDDQSRSSLESPSTFLLSTLHSPALYPSVPTAEPSAGQLLPPTPARIADGGSSTQQSDHEFSLQQFPENASPETGDDSTASRKSLSDLFEMGNAASSQMKTMLTDVDDDKNGDQEEEDDRRSMAAVAGIGSRYAVCGRQSKSKRIKGVGKRPLVKRLHSTKHVTPSMLRSSTLQQQKSKPERAANTMTNTNSNRNANARSRKTITVVNTSSEDYETEDSDGWESEDMGAEDKAREAEETRRRLHEAVLEAQHQRNLFARAPKRSYYLNRTQSGLLSQLVNPNPAGYPYRAIRSSADILPQYQQQQQRAPAQERSTSVYAPPRLSTSKSAAALPMAAQVTAVSSSRPPASGLKQKESEKNGYRPKGPPKEQEMEDESGDDADDKIQMSQSVAQQKLQALMSCRGSQQGSSSRLIQPVAMEVGPGLMGSRTTPIPLGHPYNLPAAAPPMTPRTTRRRMLKIELSESMRRQLLWERQISSNTNLAKGSPKQQEIENSSGDDADDKIQSVAQHNLPVLMSRRGSQQDSSSRLIQPVAMEVGSGSTGSRAATVHPYNFPAAAQSPKRRALAGARDRSWTNDYHYPGW